VLRNARASAEVTCVAVAGQRVTGGAAYGECGRVSCAGTGDRTACKVARHAFAVYAKRRRTRKRGSIRPRIAGNVWQGMGYVARRHRSMVKAVNRGRWGMGQCCAWCGSRTRIQPQVR